MKRSREYSSEHNIKLLKYCVEFFDTEYHTVQYYSVYNDSKSIFCSSTPLQRACLCPDFVGAHGHLKGIIHTSSNARTWSWHKCFHAHNLSAKCPCHHHHTYIHARKCTSVSRTRSCHKYLHEHNPIHNCLPNVILSNFTRTQTLLMHAHRQHSCTYTRPKPSAKSPCTLLFHAHKHYSCTQKYFSCTHSRLLQLSDHVSEVCAGYSTNVPPPLWLLQLSAKCLCSLCRLLHKCFSPLYSHGLPHACKCLSNVCWLQRNWARKSLGWKYHCTACALLRAAKYVCMYVCVWVCTRSCMHAHTHTHTRTHTYAS